MERLRTSSTRKLLALLLLAAAANSLVAVTLAESKWVRISAGVLGALNALALAWFVQREDRERSGT